MKIKNTFALKLFLSVVTSFQVMAMEAPEDREPYSSPSVLENTAVARDQAAKDTANLAIDNYEEKLNESDEQDNSISTTSSEPNYYNREQQNIVTLEDFRDALSQHPQAARFIIVRDNLGYSSIQAVAQNTFQSNSRNENIEITNALKKALALEQPELHAEDLFAIDPVTSVNAYPSLNSKKLAILFERINNAKMSSCLSRLESLSNKVNISNLFNKKELPISRENSVFLNTQQFSIKPGFNYHNIFCNNRQQSTEILTWSNILNPSMLAGPAIVCSIILGGRRAVIVPKVRTPMKSSIRLSNGIFSAPISFSKLYSRNIVTYSRQLNVPSIAYKKTSFIPKCADFLLTSIKREFTTSSNEEVKDHTVCEPVQAVNQSYIATLALRGAQVKCSDSLNLWAKEAKKGTVPTKQATDISNSYTQASDQARRARDAWANVAKIKKSALAKISENSDQKQLQHDIDYADKEMLAWNKKMVIADQSAREALTPEAAKVKIAFAKAKKIWQKMPSAPVNSFLFSTDHITANAAVEAIHDAAAAITAVSKMNINAKNADVAIESIGIQHNTADSVASLFNHAALRVDILARAAAHDKNLYRARILFGNKVDVANKANEYAQKASNLINIHRIDAARVAIVFVGGVVGFEGADAIIKYISQFVPANTINGITEIHSLTSKAAETVTDILSNLANTLNKEQGTVSKIAAAAAAAGTGNVVIKANVIQRLLNAMQTADIFSNVVAAKMNSVAVNAINAAEDAHIARDSDEMHLNNIEQSAHGTIWEEEARWAAATIRHSTEYSRNIRSKWNLDIEKSLSQSHSSALQKPTSTPLTTKDW